MADTMSIEVQDLVDAVTAQRDAANNQLAQAAALSKALKKKITELELQVVDLETRLAELTPEPAEDPPAGHKGRKGKNGKGAAEQAAADEG